ncbi:MAG: squalene--hopene cyclase [Proteobacteria bacterium]|nr:squalene--hopene cyclase [Pseudomonadota bacterium]
MTDAKNSGNGGIAPEFLKRIERVLDASVASFKKMQREDGHWVFELEADISIPAEYIMLNHFLDDLEPELETELASFIRSKQQTGGGWPLFHDGAMNISATVKGYLALKLAGDKPSARHMKKARTAILAAGGAEKSNVFTRYSLALFGQVPWRAVPVMPVELMLLPDWFPVALGKVSYWSRTVIAPLLVLAALKPAARNPKRISIAELFTTPPFEIETYIEPQLGTGWEKFFIGLDKILRRVEPHLPKKTREIAIQRAVDFFTERLNGLDGLGAIFPAMANAVMAMDALGYDRQDERFKTALKAVRNLISWSQKPRFIQPCWSPIWDTSLGLHALLEAGEDPNSEAILRACNWMKDLQILDVGGDWIKKKPGLKPGGWAFQYRNDYYPDLDDTAVVGLVLDRVDSEEFEHTNQRAVDWIVGMQSKNGGFASFDVDNTAYFLNNIPFADHGALLDPPTEDVTGRCLSFLAQLGYQRNHPVIERGMKYLKDAQEQDGSWFGRWGTNYIYGTWSVLCALNAVGEDMNQPYIRKAVDWLVGSQGEDGGWGEDGGTYWQQSPVLVRESTPSQTAWAALGLMAAGEVDHPATRRGIEYLTSAKRHGNKWEEPHYTAVGFPRVFFLRYDGYSRYFPIWALARYKNLMNGNSKNVSYGM